MSIQTKCIAAGFALAAAFAIGCTSSGAPPSANADVAVYAAADAPVADGPVTDVPVMDDGATKPDLPRPPACQIAPPTACPDPPVRYDDIADIVAQRCLTCHNGLGKEWSLIGYQHVVDWQDTIRGAMITCAMPPPESGLTMPDTERLRLLEWIRCGVMR